MHQTRRASNAASFQGAQVFMATAADLLDDSSPLPSALRVDKSLRSKRGDGKLEGLGTGPGGSVVRSCLSSSGASVVSPRKASVLRAAGGEAKPGTASSERRPEVKTPASVKRFGAECAVSPREPEALRLSQEPMLEREPQGMWFSLLTIDMSPASQVELDRITSHRWNFNGALELASQGRSICYFVWCLLELQRNVQVEEEGEVLDPKLVEACRTFVNGQCREGKLGEMYQILAHFISNSIVFHEWDVFLKRIFEDPRANQESFMVPHLEQVWARFCRLKAVLESIFDALDSRFCWRHRLPKVGDLVHQHMKRRCFSSELVEANPFFAGNAVRNEKLKEVKFAFGFG
ncbi:unnamed protein product [Polarella glacialis]|uniref:Uncharacterized protein n=1 Tax=Polarella glacialis TaxID=89957 RepID=A0A813HVH1_POLGL|nr:unnamed protein product [Polarella glacialis]